MLSVQFEGIGATTIPARVSDAVNDADVIVLCPSNPIISTGPILAIPGLRDRLRRLTIPIVAVSPIIGGQALKGPADQMLATLGHEVSSAGVAGLYKDFLTGMVIDSQDAALAERITDHVTDTIMWTDDDRRVLAEETLVFAESLIVKPEHP